MRRLETDCQSSLASLTMRDGSTPSLLLDLLVDLPCMHRRMELPVSGHELLCDVPNACSSDVISEQLGGLPMSACAKAEAQSTCFVANPS